MAEQLTTDGGAEELVAPKPRPGVRYLRDAPFDAPKEQRITIVRKLFPDYEWHDDKSVLWNWVNAHADLYFDGDYNLARRMINDISDPIFGSKNHAQISRFIWFIS